MYSASILQKERTEKILAELLVGHPEIVAITDHVKSTPVKRDGRNILDIYYRKDAIRINISKNSSQYNIYQELLKDGIAYQKNTADPNSTNGVFAFFVGENDVENALCRLLKIGGC